MSEPVESLALLAAALNRGAVLIEMSRLAEAYAALALASAESADAILSDDTLQAMRLLGRAETYRGVAETLLGTIHTLRSEH